MTLALPNISRAKLILAPHFLTDVLRAVSNLAWARFKLARTAPRVLLHRQAASTTRTAASMTGPEPNQAELVRRVAIAISRAASRVPWRSDCLVQALAAERWLAKLGVPTVLYVGARKDEQAQFFAHAWLKAGDIIVTGGEIGAYATLVGGEDTVCNGDGAL